MFCTLWTWGGGAGGGGGLKESFSESSDKYFKALLLWTLDLAIGWNRKYYRARKSYFGLIALVLPPSCSAKPLGFWEKVSNVAPPWRNCFKNELTDHKNRREAMPDWIWTITSRLWALLILSDLPLCHNHCPDQVIFGSNSLVFRTQLDLHNPFMLCTRWVLTISTVH